MDFMKHICANMCLYSNIFIKLGYFQFKTMLLCVLCNYVAKKMVNVKIIIFLNVKSKYFEFQRNIIETSLALLFDLKKESNVRLQILPNDFPILILL